MPVSEERHPIAQVTRASRDGWRKFAKKNGTNPTALAEAIGRRLADIEGEPPPFLAQAVEDAIELADKRLRRGSD